MDFVVRFFKLGTVGRFDVVLETTTLDNPESLVAHDEGSRSVRARCGDHLLMSELLSRLASIRLVRRASWTTGEFVHRRLDRLRPRRNGRGGRSHLENGSGKPDDYGERTPVPTTSGELPDVPFRPRPAESIENPVLTAGDVTDYGDVDFVADPFLYVSESEGWNLFFEVFNADREPTAVVGHATSDDRGRSWEYNRIVLRDETHLAFPYVFEWDGDFYMVPERWNDERPTAVRLYRTESLPDGWEPVSTVVQPDRRLADCAVFRWDDRWWAMVGSDDGERDLFVYYSDDLLVDEWTPHAQNPVVTGRSEAARPAGRPIVDDDRILVFFQDCAGQYGRKVRAFEVELSTTDYTDRERPDSPILEGSGHRLGWNSGRMHHVDPWQIGDGWICAVDGNIGFGQRAFGDYHWSIGIYRA